MKRVHAAAVALGVTLTSYAAGAQDAQPMRVTATIEALSGTTLALAAPGDTHVSVALAPDTRITALDTIALDAIQPGSYVGTATLPNVDGTLKALEVHVFAESMRGAGEGSRPMAGDGGKTMTNGTVGSVVGSSGRTLTLGYKGGEQHVVVGPDVPIVALAPGDASMLVPGAHVVVMATKDTAGALTATRVLVGRNGLVPPM